MAVFVRWEWKEKTKTFLVIFYFIDDKTEQNIRFRFKVVNKNLKPVVLLEDPTSNPDMASQPVMTWAPNHLEIALLGDILGYANIIDGLDEPEKRNLREKLEIQVKEGHPNLVHEEDIDDLIRDAPPSTTMLALEGASDWFFCSRLSSEYVDYLRKILLPFQRR
jgi:hypothetical protein